MQWEAKIIEFLQQDFFNGVLLFITQFGSEIFFLAVVAALYWCYDKRLGYKFFNVYLLSTAVNTGLKVLFRRPRPFVNYPDSVESIGVKESTWSFPSGHSHSAANLSTQAYLNAKSHRRTVLAVGIVLTALVMFSRLYLGQHYLTDVLAGAAIGIGLAIGFSCLFELLKDKEEWLFVFFAPVCALLAVILAVNHVDSGEMFTVLGAYLAFSVGYFFEKRYVRYNPQSDRWWKYLVKILVGVAVVFAIKEGFKLFLPESVLLLHDFLRYFILAAWASLGAPALFKLCRW